jgi:hypothetical protein
MFYDDHAPPHFHVRYAEHEATVTITTLTLLEGRLPGRVLGMVVEWASLHRTELLDDWDRARRGLPLDRIAPLE